MSTSRTPPPLEPAVEIDERNGGELILRSPYPAGPLHRSTAHLLLERGQRWPGRTLIAERAGEGWRHLTYADAVDRCRRVAQWLLEGEYRALAILSPASIDHFVMAWGAILARLPYVPVSLSYSTVPGARPKLDAILQRVQPDLVCALDLDQHREALQGADYAMGGYDLVTRVPEGKRHIAWNDLLTTPSGRDVDASIDRIDHSTITRYMFTSGSTGMPKGVIVTHGMSCHMLAGVAGLRPAERTDEESRVLDWMPWSHVGAGVMRINSVIDDAGAIYIDTGRPVPGEFHHTIENLKTVRPTSFAGAPVGWSMLVDALEKDEELARVFYAHIRSMQAGSAAMPASLAARLQALNERYTGSRFPFGTSLASTEVHGCLSKYWPSERTDIIGLPVPGAEVKLIPFGDKYELRVRSPTVTPGYLNDPEKTRESFDDEAFFRMGDAVRFADPAVPATGLVFAGRVAEEFKLLSGTWVSAGTLRAEAIAAASPYIRDAVVCGINESFVALMIWPNTDSCAELAGTDDPSLIASSEAVQTAIKAGLQHHNANNTGSSRFFRRFLLLDTPPDQGAFEITDKGYVNQQAVQSHRAPEVTRLFAESPDEGVVDLAT